MRSALLVIDFINDIVHSEGKLGSCAAHCDDRKTMGKANQASAIARNHHIPVIHVKVGFDKNYKTHPAHSPFFGQAKEYRALELDTWGTDFHDIMDVKSEDSIVVKHRVNPFYGTNLETLLRANGIDHLFISGVSSTWAIQATARDAHDRDYRVTILEDACAAGDEEEHQESMKVLSAIAAITTVDSMETLCD